MKKCIKCGKNHESETVKFCDDCGSKLEQGLEEFFPKKTVKGLKKNSILYISVLVILVVAASILAGITVKANNYIKEQRAVVSDLNLDLQKKANELSALQETLSETEEGRKQLEQAKSQVETENQKLDTRATSAEQTASKAKSDLSKAQSDLSAKQAELNRVSSDLSDKQTELDKAKRGIGIFESQEGNIDSFNYYSNLAITDILKSANYGLSGDWDNALYYANKAKPEMDQADNLYETIKAAFDRIKSGNY
jgi:DNA repair exonuclease SbcCD ATPase subunit